MAQGLFPYRLSGRAAGRRHLVGGQGAGSRRSGAGVRGPGRSASLPILLGRGPGDFPAQDHVVHHGPGVCGGVPLERADLLFLRLPGQGTGLRRAGHPGDHGTGGVAGRGGLFPGGLSGGCLFRPHPSGPLAGGHDRGAAGYGVFGVDHAHAPGAGDPLHGAPVPHGTC